MFKLIVNYNSSIILLGIIKIFLNSQSGIFKFIARKCWNID
ncbi:hypothetical protein A1OE_1307 [Candidatus Endolissoclinum faulkneri L2]|uniref:Uncharacterized protein n=1 Tax=Candidatus Endolissoclinum faulkneri L2 TaxID=1193729 RepID=K7YIQ4_9PROT|nr:hypothetical protein A1OE_1307 [Candidatus Endolissoclinum faulkneri L2]